GLGEERWLAAELGGLKNDEKKRRGSQRANELRHGDRSRADVRLGRFHALLVAVAVGAGTARGVGERVLPGRRFPRELLLAAAEVAVGRRLLVDRAEQIQLPAERAGTASEVRAYQLLG